LILTVISTLISHHGQIDAVVFLEESETGRTNGCETVGTIGGVHPYRVNASGNGDPSLRLHDEIESENVNVNGTASDDNVVGNANVTWNANGDLSIASENDDLFYECFSPANEID
jgi:hypothetical protein